MTSAGPREIEQTLPRFLDWARAQGWRYDMVPTHLSLFQRFLQSRGVRTLDQVDTALLVAYQHQLLTSRSVATVNGYMSSLRALWRYLLREGLVGEDVTKGAPYLRPDHFIPYLYRPEELARIEQATRTAIGRVHTPARRFCRQTRYTAFTLLRDCGLRVSEACRLDVEDYDRRARTLRIERTKFFKTRVIPLPRSTCARLNRYLEHRQQVTAAPGDAHAFFLSIYRRRLDRRELEAPFIELLRELGLYRPRRRQGHTVFGSTNLHALRHSFAVRTLERWQRSGSDVEHLLPLLSGYLGHVKVSYTTVYLHLTPILRQLAGMRLGELVLPRLDHCGALNEDEGEG